MTRLDPDDTDEIDILILDAMVILDEWGVTPEQQVLYLLSRIEMAAKGDLMPTLTADPLTLMH